MLTIMEEDLARRELHIQVIGLLPKAVNGHRRVVVVGDLQKEGLAQRLFEDELGAEIVSLSAQGHARSLRQSAKHKFVGGPGDDLQDNIVLLFELVFVER